MEEYSNFIYKTKKYRYNLRLSLVSSDYIWDNIKQLLNQKDFSLVDNEEDTNFSEESVTDFISYLEQPDKNKINTKNVFAFKVLNEKYKVKNLQNQINEYIQNHRLDLIVLVIVDKNDITSDDIKLVVNRLFEFIDNRQLFLLPVNFIDQILQFYRSQQPDDSIENEQKLMNFFIEYLKKQNEKGEQASLLFKHINFSKVGQECLSYIMSDCQNFFDFKCIPIEVVKILCSSYANTNTQKVQKHKRKENAHKPFEGELEIHPTKGKEFEGIMRYLTNKTGGNIHDNGTIEITSNSIANNNNQYHPKNLVDYQIDNYYSSKNEPNIIICFDFKDKKIQMTNYSIKSHASGSNDAHLRNWVIEGSNDNYSWEILDEHSNDSILNGSNRIETFSTRYNQTFYQFIRLRQTGNSWLYGNYYYIYFYFIEFYGKLK